MHVRFMSFPMILLLIAFVLYPLSAAISQGDSRTYYIRKEDSHVGFSIMKWMVFKEEGRFKDFQGTIEFDEKTPSTIKVEVTVKAASVDSRNDGRDNALRSHDFFDVSKHPTLSFKSVRAILRNMDTIDITGDFSLLGKTKRITVPVRILGVTYVKDFGHIVGFETTFVLDRTEFGMTRGLQFIGKETTINMLIGASTSDEVARR